MNRISIVRPDDWHLHIRDGDMMRAVIPFSSQKMARAVIMPNLIPPVVDAQQALAYKERIMSSVPKKDSFEALMTLYLTDRTNVDIVRQAHRAGIVAFKLYPQGATTNSESGVTDIFKLLAVLEEMQKLGILLLVHGEVTDKEIDIFDREKVFIDRVLIPIRKKLPELKIVFEHITTAEAVSFIEASDNYLAATVTPHHLLFSRNDMLVGGVKPHYYCLPILKRESHRKALLRGVTGKHGHKFFAGTDSAPHRQDQKESSCGCAGIFNAPIALELYTEIFEKVDALDQLENFVSINGPIFYGLPINSEKVTLIKEPYQVPEFYEVNGEKLIPFLAGKEVAWRLVNNEEAIY
ncbi:MAG: dihydroorotase [Neisseriaceae bacterium]|nr:MAG: dihydroorotase [Neisseriaceae bacterium]